MQEGTGKGQESKKMDMPQQQNTKDHEAWSFDFYFKHCALFSLSEPTFFYFWAQIFKTYSVQYQLTE